MKPVPVSAKELAGWLGLEVEWLIRLADRGEIPVTDGPSGYSFDPRSLAEWFHRQAPATAGAVPVDLETLRDVSLALARGESPDEVCRDILHRVLAVLGASAGAIYFADAETWLQPVATEGFDPDDVPHEVEGVVAWAGANAEPLLLPNPRRLNGVPGDGSGHGSGADDMVAVPLVLDRGVVGVIVAVRPQDRPAFGHSELSLATVIGAETALALERARAQRRLSGQLSRSQEQLEAYAVDMRKTFASERERSRQLARALGELEETYLATVRGLAAAVEAKDEYTAGHLRRVGKYAAAILQEIAPERSSEPGFEYGFLLHDVGKIGVSDAILGKPGPLDHREMREMRKHCDIGRRILEGIPFLEDACSIVYSHHERWDGTGYPRGLAGEEIPLGALIFAVADSFDAMTTDRPYRSRISIQHAYEEIRRGSGRQFWPEAVEAFLALPADLIEGVGSLDSGPG